MSTPESTSASFHSPPADRPAEGEGVAINTDDPQIKAALALFEEKGLAVNINGTEVTGAPKEKPAEEPKAASVEPKKEETPAKPAETLLAGKYKTPADLEKAYLELSKKLGSPEKASEPEKKALPIPLGAQVDPLPEDLKAKITEEVLRENNLSAETRKRLHTRGYANEYIDEYLASYRLARLAASEMAENVLGGQDRAKAAKQWGEENWPADKQAALNEAFTKRDPAGMRQWLKTLNEDYSKSRGTGYDSEPMAGTGASTGVKPLNDAEMVEAMNHPLYREKGLRGDEYRRKVLAGVQEAMNHRR